MRITTGHPDDVTTEKLNRFLHEGGLSFDRNSDYTVCIFDADDMIATGSLYRNILKCFRVDDYRQKLRMRFEQRTRTDRSSEYGSFSCAGGFFRADFLPQCGKSRTASRYM
jgi:hypothetical protein